MNVSQPSLLGEGDLTYRRSSTPNRSCRYSRRLSDTATVLVGLAIMDGPSSSLAGPILIARLKRSFSFAAKLLVHTECQKAFLIGNVFSSFSDSPHTANANDGNLFRF